MNRNLLIISVWLSVSICSRVLAQSPAIEWDKTIGGNADDNLSSIQISTDGKYILGGSTWSGLSGDKTEVNKGFSGNDFWLVGLDINGVIDWDKTIGGGSTDLLESFQITSGGGYILGGSSSSGISGDKSEDLINPEYNYEQDYWVVKLDENRNKIWDRDIGSNKPDYFSVLEKTNDGGITFEVQTTQYTCNTIHFTVITGIEDIEWQEAFNIYPNPARDKLKIQSLKFKVGNTTIELFDCYCSAE